MVDLSMLNLQLECGCSEAINALTEAVNEYNITCKEVSIATMQDSVLLESADILYEDASKNLFIKARDAIAKFFKKIGEFIAGVAKKIAAFFKGKKTEEKVQEIKEELSGIPEAASEKITVADLKEIIDRQEKRLQSIQAIVIKGHDLNEELTQEEFDSLKTWTTDFVHDEPKVEVPVKDAVSAAQKAIEYAKKSSESIGRFATKVKTKAEEGLKKAEIAGDAGAIAMCTKQLNKIQSLIIKLTEEKTKILTPIEKNIAIIKDCMKKTEIKLATNKTDAKYGSNIFKKVGGKVRSKFQNSKLESKYKKMEDQLKNIETDKKNVEIAYDAKISDAKTTYDKYKKKSDDILKSIDKKIEDTK